MHQGNSIDINFTGDVSITGVFKKSIKNNIEIFDDVISGHLKKADFNVINLEGPTTNKTTYYRNNGLVVSPYESVSYLEKRNINVFNLANNHMFDNGFEGYKDTLKAIEENSGIKFGAGINLKDAATPAILKKNGISIAMIGLCHKEGMIASYENSGVFCVDNNFNTVKKIVSNLKKKYDWVIINYHGGEEFTRIPMPSRKRLLRKLARTKTDVVIAHHSHVLQGYEVYKTKPIFYSLGNFVFDIKPHTTINLIEFSAILKFNFKKDTYTFSFFPTQVSIERGLIFGGNKDFITTIQLLSHKITSNYSKNWRKEAYRAFFHAHKDTKSNNQSFPIGKRHKNIKRLLLERDTLYKFYKLLISKNKRPLFLSALFYKIFEKNN